jgi:hypothetical protein
MPVEEPSVEDRESVRTVVERLRREYLMMTREFERLCQDRQQTYLTAIQLSEWLGITKRTLAKWRRNSKGPRFVKRSRRILYPPAYLEAWLQVRRREQAARAGSDPPSYDETPPSNS